MQVDLVKQLPYSKENLQGQENEPWEISQKYEISKVQLLKGKK